MKHLIDTYKHKGKRKILISELSEMGIKDERILEAFDAIPRHFFLDLAFDEQAYSNTAFQIGSGQTISHPYTVAFQTELLEVEEGDKVLEIGSGSGFQTCILCKVGAKVFSIERHLDLHQKARQMVEFMRFNAKMFFGDGYKGKPVYAPFDKILVTCGAPEIPKELLKQLKVGGIMVIPVGEGAEQKMLKIVKVTENEITIREFGTFKFVPMLERTVKKQ
ncbi:MAG: protein-L-isoaspartate(D-aspartate) O-methyltransferase [Flavobacteriales bacterium]|nr:protein-L-isoaspartate(D-aspartate) O-methyltransferase [Crocinitomicaceae bacterium]NBX79468.1 protein-L-isoaspartate(D-aspartate) O-methyltransferase [Flavobacteriales bacterium]NCA22001.1 protein-L-isoaspartate(D-aspartate) O-methyltransferase [Crocinitomicaceae bacterium]